MVFKIWCRSIWDQPSNGSCQLKSQLWEKQSILSTTRYKNNESLIQAGNYETENIEEHTCEENSDGLQSRNRLWNKYCKHVQSKITHQEQSIRKSNPRKKAVPVWFYQSLTHYLHGLPCGVFNSEHKTIPWWSFYLNLRCGRKENKHKQSKR